MKIASVISLFFTTYFFSMSSVALTTDYGSLEGELSVTNSGATQYVVPIEVPKGIGVSPKLFFEYSSQRMTNGVLGVGWRVGGLSSISRCKKTIAQDGRPGTIKLDNSDRYCLDGKRLVPSDGDYSSYGADGKEYRTEVDTQAKIVSHGSTGYGPTFFTVYTKDGRIIEYGNSEDSRLNLYILSVPRKGETPNLNWSMSKVSDRTGNEMLYKYKKNVTTGEQYIDSIEYFKTSSGIFNSKVEFVYSDDDRAINFFNRLDIVESYLAGAKLSSRKLLDSIKISLNSSLVHLYKLGYKTEALNGASRLETIEQCSASFCKSPIVLTYTEGTPLFTELSQTTSVSIPTETNIYKAIYNPFDPNNLDMDNNGKADFWFFNVNDDIFIDSYIQESGGFNQYQVPNLKGGYDQDLEEYSPIGFVDFDGDGFQDFWKWSFDGNIYTRLSFGDGTFDSPKTMYWSAKHDYVDGNGNFVQGDAPVGFADINGDGRADFWGWSNNGNIYVNLSLGDGTFGTRKAIYWSTQKDRDGPVGFADINGDGMADLWGWSSNGNIYTNLSLGDGTFGPRRAMYWSNWKGTLSGDAPVGFADINGDGMADFWGWSSNGNIYINLALGDGTFGPRLSLYWSNWKKGDSPVGFADINGDGMADFWGSGNTGNFYYNLSKGNGTFGDRLSFYWETDTAGANFSDFNGDGLKDIYTWRKTGKYFSATDRWEAGTVTVQFNESLKPNLLTTVTTASNNTSIEYKPLSDSTVYSRHNSAAYPTKDIQGTAYVVSSVTTEDGVGGYKTLTYRYEGAKMDLHGRGFLGFAAQTVTDSSNGQIAKNQYSQEFPTVGQLGHSTLTMPDGVVTYESSTEYDVIGTLGLTPVLSYVKSQSETHRELDNTVYKKMSNSILDISAEGCVRSKQNVVEGALGTQRNTVTTLETFADANFYGEWVICKPIRTSVTAEDTTGTSITRTWAHDYYTGSGLLKWRKDEPDAYNNDLENVYLFSEYTYDSYGNIDSVTTSGSPTATHLLITRTTHSDYFYDDPALPKVKITNYLGEYETRTYDARYGALKELTDVNQLKTQWVYDVFGRIKSETRPDLTQVLTDYYLCDGTEQYLCKTDSEVSYIEVSQSGAPPYTIFFDKYGRETRKITKGLNNSIVAQETHYNAQGLIEKRSKNYFYGATPLFITYEYDDLDRLTKETYPDNSWRKTEYGGLTTTSIEQRIGTIEQRIGQTGTVELTSKQTVTPTGWPALSVDSGLNQTRYESDPFGQKTKTIDSKDNTISRTYDVRGRLTSIDDPDLGVWSYEYDAVGNLRKQTNANQQVVTMVYDSLDRLTSSTDHDTNAISFWDYYPLSEPASNGIGKIKKIHRASDGYEELYTYNNLGDISEVNTTIDYSTYKVNIVYDNYNRIEELHYPQYGATTNDRFVQKNVYDDNGYLQKVTNGSNTITYWDAKLADADGNITEEKLGNGLTTVRDYDLATGLLTDISTGNNNSIQGLHYTYDSLGNLETRTDDNQKVGTTIGITEEFFYDSLLRLDYVNRNGNLYRDYDYDELGNITFKSDVGTYQYDQTANGRPHAVVSVGGSAPFIYDDNGNLTHYRGKTISYSSFNKPTSITTADASVEFIYTPSYVRYKKTATTGNGTTTVHYIGGIFERINTPSGVIEYKNYIYAGGDIVAVDTRRSNQTSSLRYLHKDHLGSIDVITDENAIVVDRFSFDPFGKQRVVEYKQGALSSVAQTLNELGFNRGFTGHEMISETGLIHMNGRVYDPEIARFVSPDPYVNKPTFSQSYNRYSYVLNNPLTYTDPTGFEEINLNNNDTSTNAISSAANAANGALHSIEEVARGFNENTGSKCHSCKVTGPNRMTCSCSFNAQQPTERSQIVVNEPIPIHASLEANSDNLDWKDRALDIGMSLLGVDTWVDAYNDLQSGNYLGAFTNAAMGIASFTPIGKVGGIVAGAVGLIAKKVFRNSNKGGEISGRILRKPLDPVHTKGAAYDPLRELGKYKNDLFIDPKQIESRKDLYKKVYHESAHRTFYHKTLTSKNKYRFPTTYFRVDEGFATVYGWTKGNIRYYTGIK